MNFLALLGVGKARRSYEELPDDVLRVIISFLDRETALNLAATSTKMRARIESFRLPIPRRFILHFTISTRQRDLRLCTRDDPAVCRIRVKSGSESIDMLLTGRTSVILRPSLIGLVGTPTNLPTGQNIEGVMEKIILNARMDLENVRFLCDEKPFRFDFGQEQIDRRRIVMILNSICGSQ